MWLGHNRMLTWAVLVRDLEEELGKDPVRYMTYLAETIWAVARKSSRMLNNMEEDLGILQLVRLQVCLEVRLYNTATTV
jgi:hypothetical protein